MAMKSHKVSVDSVSTNPATGTSGSGNGSVDARSNPAVPSTGGRSRDKDREERGLPPRDSLRSLARTYLETQARLWPELAGTPAVPAIKDAVVEAMADDFERRFRSQAVDVFDPAGLRRVWIDIGLGYVRFSDEGSNPRSLDQQLNNVLQRARRDGVFIPWHYVCADYAVSGTLACRRGYSVAKTLVERRAELKEEQRRNRRPPVRSVKEKDVVVALTQLREVLLADVGRAAPVLQALVGDVVVESKKVEGQKRPEMVAKFTIDGIPALATLERGNVAGGDNPTVGLWEFLNTDRWIMLGKAPRGRPAGAWPSAAASPTRPAVRAEVSANRS